MECRRSLSSSSSVSCLLARVVAPSHHHSYLPPNPSGLIVLHLFIQAFMAASPSWKPISPPDDGFLPQLSRLFIISVDPHHIPLTLGRWFSHWTPLTVSSYHKSYVRKVTQPERKPSIVLLQQIYKALKVQFLVVEWSDTLLEVKSV